MNFGYRDQAEAAAAGFAAAVMFAVWLAVCLSLTV